MTERICDVFLLDAPFVISHTFAYLLPEGQMEDATRGRMVALPFGKGNRATYGVIARVYTGDVPEGTKAVHALVSDRFMLDEEMFALCHFLSSYTLCSFGEAVRSMLPVHAFGDLIERYTPLSDEEEIPRYLAEHGEKTLEELTQIFGASCEKEVKRLLLEGKIKKHIIMKGERREKEIAFYRLQPSQEEILALIHTKNKVLRSEKQKEILTFLLDHGETSYPVLREKAGATSAQMRTLVARKWVKERCVKAGDFLNNLPAQEEKKEIKLSTEQEKAYQELSLLHQEAKPAAALLYGVTGSGKTSVMIRLIDDVLSEGKSVILLVPEIALTPQTLSIFCRRYGESVAVVHSGRSFSERLLAYSRIREGKARLVIGTRSAIFAPVQRLGLVLIDEEHEHTYKSEQNPKYHARDVAAFRCGKNNALMLLASATPSIESFYKAQTGKYHLVTLKERYGKAVLPTCKIIDLREELIQGNTSPFSLLMQEKLAEVKKDNKQAILFLNRRGYHSAISCKSCGEALICQNCSVALTHHASYSGGYLSCHTCGFRMRPPKTCPSCGGVQLSYLGFGTQRAESELLSLVENITVLRMDADTTTGKNSYDRMIESFRMGEHDVLLGTQMVTKGHDFPSVTLSGVLLADSSLYMSDFRAAEQTFSLLTQVIGRAGRAKNPGCAVIQTFCPNHEVIRLAAKQDYLGFYTQEIAYRKGAMFPPFCDLVRVMLSSKEEKLLYESAEDVKAWFLNALQSDKVKSRYEVYGPLEMQTFKVGGKFRMKFILKCRWNEECRAVMRSLHQYFSKKYNMRVSFSVDANPMGE